MAFFRRPHLLHHRRRSSQTADAQPHRSRRRKGRVSSILFRIFYSTSFTIVFLITIGFICAAAVDILYTSYKRNRLIDIFILSGAYVVTGLVVIFVYASRLYTNRTILKDIPKTYIPMDKAELPRKRVWRLLEDCKSRSAVIAYEARPRARRIEVELPMARQRIDTLLRPEHTRHFTMYEPQWGPIEHRGWSGPDGFATETPDLEYATVVKQLLDLVEAKAVSLIPLEDKDEVRPELVEALARPLECGMRQYIGILASLGILDNDDLTVAFLTMYEKARFGGWPLSEQEFKTLMRMFAELLRSMKAVDISKLELPAYESDNEDNYADAKSKPRNYTRYDDESGKQSRVVSTARGIASSTSSLNNSIRHHTPSHEPTTDYNTNRSSTLPQSSVRAIQRTPSEQLGRRYASSRAHDHYTTMGYEIQSTASTASLVDDDPDSASIVHHSISHPSEPQGDINILATRTSQSPQLDARVGEETDDNSVLDLERTRTARSQISVASGRSGRSGVSDAGSVVVRLTRPGEARELPYVIEMPRPSDAGIFPR